MPRMSPHLKRYLLLEFELSENDNDEITEELFKEIDSACEALSEIELDLVNAIWSYKVKHEKMRS